MNRSFAKFLTFAAAACVSACALFARDTNIPTTPPPPTPVDVGFGGLQTSLTTGGYRFVISDATAKPTTTGTPVVVPDTFPACASLQNRSPFDIAFTFPNAAEADLKFTFRVFDSAGTLLWQSDTNLTPTPASTEVALGKFQRWKRTIAIPLKPGGKALAAGIYTLEASIDADKQVGASAVFEVVAGPTPPDPTKTGINGLVLKADSVPVDGQPAPTESPAAGALVVINEVVNTANTPTRPPFNWSGKTDDLGQFTTNAPAGHYRVTANYVSPAPAAGSPPPLVYPPKTVEVDVVDQQFANVTIHLVPLAPPPPPPTQGIKGHVLIGAGGTVETPFGGAAVTVDQVTDAAGAVSFHWQGTAGPDGGFQVSTPPGNFKVTAAAPNGSNLTPAPVTVNVTVAAGVVSEVTLHLVVTPPPVVQGIRGRVWVPNPIATTPGAPAEIPFAGAQVKIDQVTDNTTVTPFHWQGVSGPEGVFSAQTPTGTFKVTATVTALPPTPGGKASAVSTTVTVIVTAGKFSEVALHIGSTTVATR